MKERLRLAVQELNFEPELGVRCRHLAIGREDQKIEGKDQDGM